MSTAVTGRALKREAEKALRFLRINGTFTGLKYLVYAVSETALDPDRTYLITKDLYREIAHKYKTTPSRVERNMRWAIHISWNDSRNEFDQMAGYHLVKRPTNKEFIDLVAFYIRSK